MCKHKEPSLLSKSTNQEEQCRLDLDLRGSESLLCGDLVLERRLLLVRSFDLCLSGDLLFLQYQSLHYCQSCPPFYVMAWVGSSPRGRVRRCSDHFEATRLANSDCSGAESVGDVSDSEAS